ncbi:MAG: hypothetical protein HY721_23485 [Planctomycetes bacterium]|nr:hypothetical protein [Planctomycetota bacterium]
MPAHARQTLRAVLATLAFTSLRAEVREVGPGRTFARIEDALAKAKAGDTVRVHPLPGGKAYERSALLVRTPRLAFQAVRGPGGERVRIDGTGFEYSGSGRTPRAIFQLDPGADGCVIEGFELTGARNESSNGAGVRINAANDATVRDCEIHSCDMGVMSNGEVAKGTGRNQLFESCLIRDNGTERHVGYNHNLYLGGTSAVLRGCEVRSSTTGHNVKSRAHVSWIEACYIHDSANRELDLVDAAGTTDVPGSDSVVLGCVIVKAREAKGNRTVIHFGQDGGRDHAGTLHLVHNTIVTPYISPVVDLSAPGAAAVLRGNIVWDAGSGQRGQVLVAARDAARLERVSGSANWLSGGFALPPGLAKGNLSAERGESLPFADASRGDYRLRAAPGCRLIDACPPLDDLRLPARPGKEEASPSPRLLEYRHPLAVGARPEHGKLDIGAYEAARP